jgi:hypothetical protein
MNSEREGEEEEEEGEAEEQRWRREETRGKEDKEPPLSLPSRHRPADDPRCVRRTFPGTHGRASLLSPAVPGDAVGRTDWLATDRPVAFPPRLQGASPRLALHSPAYYR